VGTESFIIACENYPYEAGDLYVPNFGELGCISAAAWGIMSAPLRNITDDNEAVLSGFASPDGVIRITAEDRLAVEEPIVVVSTDRRLIVTPRSGAGKTTVSVSYADLASATVDGGVTLTTTEGTVFECELSAVPGVSPAAARRHLRWLGGLRSDVLGCRNDVELAAGEIERLAEDLEWDDASARYEQARQRLDGTFARVLAVEEVAPDALAPELTAVDRALERAHARLHARHAESQLDLAQQLLETDAHEQCRKVLRQVQAYAGRASGCGHAVQRGDHFQFGEQRDLQRELDSLRWRIGAFAAELVTGARDACLQAQETLVRAEAITHYRRALERYGHALTLEDEREERQLIDSPAAVRRERDRVAAQLIDLHELAASERWDDGVDRQEAGEQAAALQACLDAKDHFEVAHGLTVEFAPGRSGVVANQLETIADVIAQMRTAREASERPPETEAREAAGQDPSASDLADIDTHHEVVFEADGLTRPAGESDGGRSPEQEQNGDDPDADGEQASPDERLN
jgi:hypothetical protein